jgi:hypothetical protein
MALLRYWIAMVLKTLRLENMMKLYEFVMYQRVLYIDTLTLANEFERLDELMMGNEICSLLKYCLGYQLN